ncbi:hypothetical protein BPAE_0334g00050 [Botrytis paeoniae]|uniref:Cytochrome P450 monooxygenase n=1 Tax=Botrytis paeoniae TaxID=278948 RepID=A0A4Z1F875_9HELO|nr:hypothetical protein BPAE_0334g00050 [Botrytis paeoniae]
MAVSNILAHVRQSIDFQLPYLLLIFIVLANIALSLFWLYRLALPRPIPGIPYDESSVHKLLGDFPNMTSHIAKRDGTFITYIIELMVKLDAPLIQVFIRPFSKPLLILADFREAHDILIHRKEFDRSDSLGDLVKGLAPDHHIHLKTNTAWKMQRRLVQDLMTPSFLHNVAGPVIHQHACVLIDLWCAKSTIADGIPFPANDDINHVALDAVMAFAFGEDFNHSMTRPNFEAIKKLDRSAIETLKKKNKDGVESIEFPKAEVDKLIQATLDLTETVGEVQGNPFPMLTWAWVMRKPKVKNAFKIKENYITTELNDSIKRLGGGKKGVVKSAVDHLIIRETGLAEKDGRAPNYLSRPMIDEVFGFVFAGHETTSTTICWGLKFLSDNQTVQSKLRTALQTSLATAKSQGRNPTIQEITGSHIHYLDATIEEVLRCASTAPVVDRQAIVDTEILGYCIPKGTVITSLVGGPSMMIPAFAVDEGLRSPTSQATKKEGRDRAWDPQDMSLFRPERWILKDDFEATAGPQLAFGLGTRGCYGKRLVYLEMKILLTLIVWNFELDTCPAAFSGYKSVLITTNEPRQCYVKLKRIDRS